MAWQSAQGMSGGNGVGNGGEGGNQVNQPQGTEYTLQGVMRFLQTEWHRHERDRNAWEIERQEMKARIASLEGAGRRADAHQKSLSKYVKMLEGALQKERKKAQAGEIEAEPGRDVKENHVAKKPKFEKPHNSFVDVKPGEENEESEPARSDLKAYLDQCGGEFTYLMVSPSNLPPPRESPPPQPSISIGEIGQAQGIPTQEAIEAIYLQQSNQKSLRDIPRIGTSPNHLAPPVHLSASLPIRNNEVQAAPMVRSAIDTPIPPGHHTDWPATFQLSDQREDENVTQVNHTFDSYGRPVENDDGSGQKEGRTEAEGWDFNESGQYPDPEPKPAPSRPDTDLFPPASQVSPKSPNRVLGSQRRKGSMSRRRSAENDASPNSGILQKTDGGFKVRFGLRGHLDAVRSVIFTGGGSPAEPELCSAGDDGVIKRWILPPRYDTHGGVHNSVATDLDIQSYYTHRGHNGAVLCLASTFPAQGFSSGGRAQGDGWVFSGGQDAAVRVWERGRVDPKATLDGHTDAVWTICVLPGTVGAVFGQSSALGGADRIIIVSGAADGAIKVWSVTAPPTPMAPQAGSGRRGVGRVRGNSVSSGSAFPLSPQPSVASNSPFNYTLVHTIRRTSGDASPTCITPLSPSGENFVVSYSDAQIVVYDTRTGEDMATMASTETYKGTMATGVNSIVASTTGLDSSLTFDSGRGLSEDDGVVHGATGSSSGIEGIIISGHEDRYIRFFDANSGQCTYNMLAHPAAISALSLSPDGRELVSAGHDASLRFWSLEKRSCTQEITSHRLMRGEGVCAVVWSQDGRWVVSGGGDGVVKVFAR